MEMKAVTIMATRDGYVVVCSEGSGAATFSADHRVKSFDEAVERATQFFYPTPVNDQC